MGRKPNALILQHFERGPKLTDSSNRYQHTCRSCGEKFPKGRIDSLTTHLVKKCPALSLHDRKKALMELNNMPSVAEGSRGDNSMGQGLEMHDQQTWTALETLAEVSRLHMEEKPGDHSVGHTHAGGSRASEPPRMARLEMHETFTWDNPPVSYDKRLSRDKKPVPKQKPAPRERDTSLPTTGFPPHTTTSRPTSPNLAMAASSIAAASAAATAARFVPSMVDPQLLRDDANGQVNNVSIGDLEQALTAANASFNDNMFNSGPIDQHMTWPMLHGGNNYMEPNHQEQVLEDNEQPQVSYSPTAMTMATNPVMTTQFATETGLGMMGSSKAKVRGKFTSERRKQVQGVRSKGACIRCRMLKKPCSEGSPCTTCTSVESARLWKHPCVRTRLKDELEMYSAGLHAVLAYHEVSSAKTQIVFRPSPNAIEASHYPDTTVFASFVALEGQRTATELINNPDSKMGDVAKTFRILDNDNDDLPLKLEVYMKQIANVFFEHENSRFMNVTLRTAQRLALEKDDALLAKTLELWSIVHILVDHELRWTISERVSVDAPAGQGPIIENSSDDGIYGLLCLQLNAAAEKKAAAICKSVLGELERRLLTRQANSSFETFLVAIVLLNCIEKSTWLFKSWEQEDFKARWPLDKIPNTYAVQGEQLTVLLHMLLRMRNVPPKTFVISENGVLATDSSMEAKKYYEELQLSYADVLNKQANHAFDPTDSRCYELRFCSQLILPVSP